MTSGVPAKVIASAMGLGAFAVAIIAGLSAENPAEQILVRAMVSMFTCHAVGFAIGLIAERTVTESITQYIGVHPLPDQQPQVGAGMRAQAGPVSRRAAA